MPHKPYGSHGGRSHVLIVLALLLAQYALGMAVNLYAQIPSRHPGARPTNYFSGSVHSVGWAIAHGPLTLAADAALGLFLVLAAVGALVGAVRARRRTAVVATVLGAGFTIGAGFNGASFLDFNHDISSLIMALLFALAVLSYVAALTALAPRRGGP